VCHLHERKKNDRRIKLEEREYQTAHNCLNEYSRRRNQFQRSVIISHRQKKT